MNASYLDKEKDRIRTILAGTPLSAEGTRLSEELLGSQWHGTSWFFLMHLVAKSFSREEKIPFSSLQTLVNDYGIENWKNPMNLQNQLDKLVQIFAKRGIENVHLDNKYNLLIDGNISNKELRNYASSQYEYAMGKGLTRYSYGYGSWTSRNMSNFAERIWWHYMTMVYDSPRLYNSPNQESALKGLFQDMTEKMGRKNLSYNGIDVWKRSNLEHGLALLEGWERGLISRNILSPFKFGEVYFIAPRFFAEPDGRPLTSGGAFSGENLESMLTLIEKLRRYPAYPIFKGNKDEYVLCRKLERAGAVSVLEEPETSLDAPPLVYLVSRDLITNLEKKINFKYSINPTKEFGDPTISEEVFRMLGRARAISDKVIPGFRIENVDYKLQIDSIIDDLESKGEADLGNMRKIFNPLNGCLHILEIDQDNHAVVNQNFTNIITMICDLWNELINDPEITNITFPAKKTIEKSEKGQVQMQIKKSMERYFEL